MTLRAIELLGVKQILAGSDEEQALHLLSAEFEQMRVYNPDWNLISLRPSIDSQCKLVCPTKSEYLQMINQCAGNAKEMGFFGVYYSGSTFWKTGDWAVLSDDRQRIDSISFQDIY